MTIRRIIWFAIAAFAFAISAIVISACSLDYYWHEGIIADGSYPLTVKVRPTGNRAISSIIVAPEGQVGEAEQNLAQMLDPRIDPNSIARFLWVPIKRERFDGMDLTVEIPFSEHIRTPAIRPSYVKSESQFGAILIFAILDDGSRTGKVMAVPHRSKSREVTVTLP